MKSDPAAAARRLLEIARTIEPIQDGRIHIEKINLPFVREGATPAEDGREPAQLAMRRLVRA